MRTNLQTITWLYLCLGVAVGGAPLFLALLTGVTALFVLIRHYGYFIDGVIFLFLIASFVSLLRGNPPVGVFIVLFSVILAAHFSKIISRQCIPENIFYFCMLVAILPLFGSDLRYSGVFDNSNMMASYICTHMALFFVLGMPLKFKTVLVFLVCCACVLLSGSRSWSLVAICFTLIVIIRLYQQFGRTILVKLLLSISTLIMVCVVPWTQLMTKYLGVFIARFSALSQGGDGSTTARLENLYIAVEAISEKPFFGDGISGFYMLSGERYHSHSTILELLVSFGLVIGSGLVLFLFIMVAELVLTPRYYGLKRLEGIGLAFYISLFLFFDSILSNVLALIVIFSLLTLSTRWKGVIRQSVFNSK